MLALSQATDAAENDLMLHPDFWAGLFLCSTWKKLRTMAAEDPAYLEVAEAMEKTHLEDPEVSPARYHDRM